MEVRTYSVNIARFYLQLAVGITSRQIQIQPRVINSTQDFGETNPAINQSWT